MEAASLRIDADDLGGVLVDIEHSFAITLPRNLQHVVTAGDLFHEIATRLDESVGMACPTSMTFYALRRLLASRQAPPATQLASLGVRSPRAMRRLLAEQTNWVMPGLVLTGPGCASALVFGVTASVAAWWWSLAWMIAPLLVAVAVTLARLDPGSWNGSWNTLGDLSRSIAATNQAELVRRGARQSPATTWHALVTMLSDVMPDSVAITPESRLFD